MTANVTFYAKDLEAERPGVGKFVRRGVLHVRVVVPSTADVNAVAQEIDVPAEASHLQAYPAELKRFLALDKILSANYHVVEAEPV